MIGAGSTSFGLGTLGDLFAARDVLQGNTIVLDDVKRSALQLMTQVAQRMNEASDGGAIRHLVDDRAL